MKTYTKSEIREFNRMQNFINEYKDLCLKHKYRIAVDMSFRMSVIPLKTPEALDYFIEELEHNTDL